MLGRVPKYTVYSGALLELVGNNVAVYLLKSVLIEYNGDNIGKPLCLSLIIRHTRQDVGLGESVHIVSPL